MNLARTVLPLLAIVSAAAPSRASYCVTTYANNNAGGGVNIQAEYSNVLAETMCDPANVRYIQLVTLRNADGTVKNDVPGYPNGNFIDPQPMQAGKMFDNQPWYDFTYNSAADRAVPQNQQNGAGPYFNDSPAGWGPFGPMSFNVLTEIVCIDPTKMTFQFLGGFSWGFNVAMNGTITQQPLNYLTDSAALRKQFNDGLAAGPATFSAWSEVASTTGKFLTVCPEPSTYFLFAQAFGIMVIGARWSRNRATRRSTSTKAIAA